ncbi:MAG: DUF924 family protein [Burkholderiales bacterium]
MASLRAIGPQDIVDFWFGEDAAALQQRRALWFSKQPTFDDEIRRRFQAVYLQAAADGLQAWKGTAPGCLALILLLDQFPRNMFRSSAKAFATDTLALAIAQQTLRCGFDEQLTPLQRMFVYLPFEHCEDLRQQQRSLELFGQLAGEPEMQGVIDYALRHYEVIRRFGRFPHRNALLSRASTAQELEFLRQPDSGF